MFESLFFWLIVLHRPFFHSMKMVSNLSLITVCFNPSLILVYFSVYSVLYFVFFNDYDDEYDLYITHLT